MYGPILKQAPEGFVPHYQWPEYGFEADVPPFLAPRAVGKNPTGMYRRFWPIVVEEYISDNEPVLADSDPEGISLNRVLIWQRVFREDHPSGWRKLTQRPPGLEGFAELGRPDYWATWSESARRYRRKWHDEYAGKEYAIETITGEEFIRHYTASSIKPFIKKLYSEIVVRKQKRGSHIDFFAVRHSTSKEIISAMSVVDSPTHKASYYLCGFIKPEYEKIPAMVGLMDEWHARGLRRGMRFLHFGRFWQKGDPSDWKGFSLFKSKFGLQYVAYPPALWRLARGRLF
jgi:hypothetical protein